MSKENGVRSVIVNKKRRLSRAAAPRLQEFLSPRRVGDKNDCNTAAEPIGRGNGTVLRAIVDQSFALECGALGTDQSGRN